MTDRPAVLLMAYGTPSGLDDVEAYYTHIRRGRPPPPELLDELVGRYRAIGGRSPLLEITHQQAAGLQERLGIPVHVGQKHAAPFIADAVADMAAAGTTNLVGLVLAPHFSKMSIGDYERRARLAAEEHNWDGELHMVDSWHLEPGFIKLLARRIEEARAMLPGEANSRTRVVFTAHSLPASIVKEGDPYAEQLEATAAAVASALDLEDWTIGFQSAGRTADPWIGPDLLDVIDSMADEGVTGAIVCPCGFVADHLEVLYDVDIEAMDRANSRGIALVRTKSPNADSDFLDVLASVAREALDASA
ncbi:MAG: protoporphyrin/coproporphyrin ferrochelatase [Actinomycetota bacterium]|nr:protoporphyrin/coproporphyrin ferrochelatase [Actinomycetota bacterium]